MVIKRSTHTNEMFDKDSKVARSRPYNPKQICGQGSKGLVCDDGTISIFNTGDNEYDLYVNLNRTRTYKPYELVDLAIAILEGVPDEEYIISKRV